MYGQARFYNPPPAEAEAPASPGETAAAPADKPAEATKAEAPAAEQKAEAPAPAPGAPAAAPAAPKADAGQPAEAKPAAAAPPRPTRPSRVIRKRPSRSEAARVAAAGHARRSNFEDDFETSRGDALMANANAIVDKMAGSGSAARREGRCGDRHDGLLRLRRGGRLAATINTTPEQVKKAAQQSDRAISTARRSARRSSSGWRTRITSSQRNFAAAVEEQIKIKLVADQYKPLATWVTPEPGAGLIRDMPELIAPTELYAYPGRGGLLVYARDEEGEQDQALKEGEERGEAASSATATPRVAAARAGRRHGRHDGRRGARRSRKSQMRSSVRRRKSGAREERKLQGELVGGAAKEDLAKKDEDKEEGGPFKEITKGYRWVAITGTLDHGQMLANYREALKNPAVAHPQYIRLDLQRRVQQSDGILVRLADGRCREEPRHPRQCPRAGGGAGPRGRPARWTRSTPSPS